MEQSPLPPTNSYSRGERASDVALHALGGGGALLACAWLVLAAPRPLGLRVVVALGVYAFGLLAMYGCSALYHMGGPGPGWALRRRLDHAAIFAMIAGTYTPVALLGIRGTLGMVLLASVWAGALAGVALKLFAPARFERLSILAYLLLGWAGVVAIGRLLEALPATQLALLLAGGVVFSLGVVLHLWRRLPYHNSLWHGCVLAASACHYVVVLTLVQG